MSPTRRPDLDKMSLYFSAVPHPKNKGMVLSIHTSGASSIKIERAFVGSYKDSKSDSQLSYTTITTVSNPHHEKVVQAEDLDLGFIVNYWYSYKITIGSQVITEKVQCTMPEIPHPEDGYITVHPYRNAVLLQLKINDNLTNYKLVQCDSSGKQIKTPITINDKSINNAYPTPNLAGYPEKDFSTEKYPKKPGYIHFEYMSLAKTVKTICVYGINEWGTSTDYYYFTVNDKYKLTPNLNSVSINQYPYERAVELYWNTKASYYTSYLNNNSFSQCRHYNYLSLKDHEYGDTISFTLQLESYWGIKSQVVTKSFQLKKLDLSKPEIHFSCCFVNKNDKLELSVYWKPVTRATAYYVNIYDITAQKRIKPYTMYYSNFCTIIAEKGHKYKFEIASYRDGTRFEDYVTEFEVIATPGGIANTTTESIYALCVAGTTSTGGSWDAFAFKKAMEANYINHEYMLNPTETNFLKKLQYICSNYDKIILYLNGHGSVDDIGIASDSQNTYANLQVTYQKIADVLDSYGSREKFIFINSCHSGTTVDGVGSDTTWDGSKALTEYQEYKDASGKKRSKEFIDKSTSKLKSRYHVLCSAKADINSPGWVGAVSDYTKYLAKALGWDTKNEKLISNSNLYEVDGENENLTMYNLYCYIFKHMTDDYKKNKVGKYYGIPVLAPVEDSTPLIQHIHYEEE